MKHFTGLLLILALLLTACTAQPAPVAKGIIQVTVSIPPQAWLVKGIGGDLVSVQSMAGPADDPHTYEPRPDQITSLADTQLYLTIGVEFENAWLPRFSAVNSRMTIKDSTAGIARMAMPNTINPDSTQPTPTAGGELDPHLWLAPSSMKLIAQNIAADLQEIAPQYADAFKANLASVLNQIDQVDQQIKAELSGITRDHFLIIHPSLGYFAKEYGLTMLPVEVGGLEPGPKQLAAILDLARQHDVTVVFTQKGLSPRMADALASELNSTVVELDPQSADWPTSMIASAKALHGALR